jgi:hypothetical protein
VAERRRHDERFLEGALGVLAQNGHVRAMHLLAGSARVARAVGLDGVHHHLVVDVHVGDALADGIDHPRAVGAENRWQ